MAIVEKWLLGEVRLYFQKYAKELQVHMKDYKQGLKQNIKNILVIAIAMDNQTSDLTAVPTQVKLYDTFTTKRA